MRFLELKALGNDPGSERIPFRVEAEERAVRHISDPRSVGQSPRASAGTLTGPRWVVQSLKGAGVNHDARGVFEGLDPNLSFSIDADVVLTDSLGTSAIVDFGKDAAFGDRVGLLFKLQ